MSKGKRKPWDTDPVKQSQEARMKLWDRLGKQKMEPKKIKISKPKPPKLELHPYTKGLLTQLGEYEYKPGEVYYYKGRQFGYGMDFGLPNRRNHMLKEAIKMLGDKYPGHQIIVREDTMGDYVEMRCGEWNCRIDNTFLASAHPLEIAQKIEQLLHLREQPEHNPYRSPFRQEYDGEWDMERMKKLIEDTPSIAIKETTKSATEQWAEDWAKKHEEGKNSV